MKHCRGDEGLYQSGSELLVQTGDQMVPRLVVVLVLPPGPGPLQIVEELHDAGVGLAVFQLRGQQAAFHHGLKELCLQVGQRCALHESRIQPENRDIYLPQKTCIFSPPPNPSNYLSILGKIRGKM